MQVFEFVVVVVVVRKEGVCFIDIGDIKEEGWRGRS